MEFKREKYLSQLIKCKHSNFIKILTGLRRCGKSYLLNTIFRNHLLEAGVPSDHIISFAFDIDEDIDKLDPFLPDEPTKFKDESGSIVINSHKFRMYVNSLIKDEKDYFLLLDEVQRLESFVETLNGFLRHENYDVYVTGSNSKLLSSDIDTMFRGRGHVIHLSPLSFKEYLEAFPGEFNKSLNNYLIYGGMPLAVLQDSEEDKQSYLRSLFRETYLKDIVERFKIKNKENIGKLLNVLASAVGSLTNPKKLADTMRSVLKEDLSEHTIDKYISFLENAFLVNQSLRYDIKGKEYFDTPYKVYFSDLGIRNAELNFRQIEPPRLMENAIYNELRNRGYSIDVGSVEVLYKNEKGLYARKQLECDFVVNKGDKKYYVQSVFKIENEEKMKAEKASLRSINDFFKKIIIVNDEIPLERDDDGIIIVSLKDFLLKYDSLDEIQ